MPIKSRIAMFKSIYGYSHVLEEESVKYGYDEYTQLTEFVDVYFPELTKDVVIAQQVKIVDGLIEKAKQEAIDKMNQLQQRKQELLALGND